MDSSLDALQQKIGHRFADPALMERALTHRSYGADHNERLEFLGDAVLSLVVSSLLFDRLGDSDEGDLTRCPTGPSTRVGTRWSRAGASGAHWSPSLGV